MLLLQYNLFKRFSSQEFYVGISKMLNDFVA
jgi:hypothetical protein